MVAIAAGSQAITGFDEQIEKLAQQHPDFAIFASFPGAGPALAPRLMAALGNAIGTQAPIRSSATAELHP